MHESALRFIYNDKSSSFREPFERDVPVTIHERDIWVLLTEIFKVNSRVGPELLKEI